MTPDERKQLLAEEWAKKKARSAPMAPLKPTLDQQVGPLMKSYRAYLEREANEIGVPVEELQERIDRMKEWADYCMANPQDKAALDRKREELFGPDDEEGKVGGAACLKCWDRGEYFDKSVFRKKHGKTVGPYSAYVVCDCEAGQERRDYVNSMGRRKKPKDKRGPREVDKLLDED